MARTESKMISLGTPAPDFKLPDTEGHLVELKDFARSKGLLVMFICNHCPFVKHLRISLSKLTAEYMSKGIAVVGISSNDAENYPEDSPKKMALEKKEQKYLFPYLYDESQSVARAFDAACTPDFYLFDKNFKLVYRGQFDGSRPGNNVSVTGSDLKAAMDALLTDQAISAAQIPSLGCGIKWKHS